MEFEDLLGGVGAEVVAVFTHDGRDPGRLARPLQRVHLGFAPARIHDDQPDQPGSHDEPDDQQPDIELGSHPRKYTERDGTLPRNA